MDKEGRDFLLYIAIGVAVAGIAVGLAVATGIYNLDMWRTMAWMGFGFMTLVLFGCLINSYRAHRKSVRLWVVLACLLIAHLTTGALLIPRFQRIQLVLFAIIFVAELPLMSALLSRFLKNGTTHHHKRANHTSADEKADASPHSS